MRGGVGNPYPAWLGECREAIEKMEGMIRPWIDQFPGTGTDYYCIQEGIASLSAKGIGHCHARYTVAATGSIDASTGGELTAENPAQMYSCLLNNFWETNFNATVEGFYEFRYFITWGSEFDTTEKALNQCHGVNGGFLNWRI